MKTTTLVACLLSVTLLGLETSAEPLTITESIMDEGRVVGFKTVDPKVIYMVPRKWSLYSHKMVVEPIPDTSNYELYFIVCPNFDESFPVISRLIQEDPNRVFLPVPQRYKHAEIAIPEAAGTIQTSLLPDNEFNQTPLIYFKLEVTSAQLEIMRTLAEAKIYLNGYVQYEYPVGADVYETLVPLYLDYSVSDLEVRARSEVYAYEWIGFQLFHNRLKLAGVVDGSYYLGMGIYVRLRDSLLTGQVLAEQTRFDKKGDQILIDPTATNFISTLTFYVPEINMDISVDMQSELSMSLNLMDLSLQVTRLQPSRIEVNGNGVGSFYAQIIQRLLADRNTLTQLSNELTSEFRRRILNQTLFIE